MHTLDLVDAGSLRPDLPDFRAGDTLKVHVRVVEGNKSRIQVFQGVVIRRQGAGVRALALLLDAGLLAAQVPQVVQLRPPYVTAGHHLDLLDHGGV